MFDLGVKTPPTLDDRERSLPKGWGFLKLCGFDDDMLTGLVNRKLDVAD